MGDRRPEETVDSIITFLNKERELFGDFSVAFSSLENSVKENEENSQKQEESVDTAQPLSPENESSSHSSSNLNHTDIEKVLSEDVKNTDPYSRIEHCNSLEELEALCKKADVLRTDLEGTNLVFGVGNSDADLMLIGEAPGAEEDKQGEPFVGAAGQLLNKILGAINFNRDDIYIANILKHRPPNNRNPLPEERKRSLPFLLKQIELINPKLILSLGKVSAQTLLDNKNSLSSMRGTFHPFRDKYELLATYHPAALLRHAKWKRPTWKDVQLLRKRYDELGGEP